MRKHTLKTHTIYYQEVVKGDKTFEVRRNDRNFQVGDILLLIEIYPETFVETGRSSEYVITYILDDSFGGLLENYVCIAIKPAIYMSLPVKGAVNVSLNIPSKI